MARKLLNRKELREESEAAERADKAKKTTAAKQQAAGKEASAKPKRKSRSKAAAEVRLKAFWGVFNQSLKRVALFEYAQRAQALKKAEELTQTNKTPHFVQLVKEVIQEQQS